MPEPRDNPLCRLAHDATDQQAWAAVVERYGGVCWRIALRMLGDRDAAADAVQDCLLAVRSAAPRFAPGEDAEGAAMAWVARVAVNTCHASRRRQRPTVRLPPQIAAPAPAPLAADDDLLAHLREAIAQLPASLREAVSLRYLAGCDNAAVATALAIEPGTARVRIHRAIEALRTLLGRRGVALPALALVGLLDGVASAAEPPLPAAMVQRIIASPAPAAAGGLSAGMIAAVAGAVLVAAAATVSLWPA
ncbi:MAG: sigma-70 family RNA polymerase sigma factor, partial [Planctomycetes bacterium]|nr:sigma-70 family RNA polymerase sigma factor [Planctomycetota bacterium]